MRRRRLTALLLVAVVGAVAAAAGEPVALGAAGEPVPTPVHVQAGAAAADGTVAWTPAVQRVTGDVGATVAVDLALDDGTEHEVEAELAVRAVEVDPRTGPTAAGASDALVLAARSVTLRPGDRGVLRATAVVPPEPTLVGVEARLVEDQHGAAPLALVLVGPPVATDVTVDLVVDEGRARVLVWNGASFPALVDVAVSAGSWVGRRSLTQVHDVLVAGDGTRLVEIDLPAGVGRLTVEAAVAARGGPADDVARARTAVWLPGTWLTLLAATLILLAGAASVRALRRS